MAYPAYETYSAGYPLQHSLSHGPPVYGVHPTEFGYADPGYGVAFTDPGYATSGVYPAYGPQRSLSQYGRAYDDLDIRDPYYADHRRSAPYGLQRRASRMSRSLSRMSRHAGMGYDAMRSTVIKFKRKGGFRSGITLGEAMSDAHLSQNHEYSLYDLNADARGRIILKIRWTGYNSMTYELPADCYDGRVELQTLARRIARACVHFLQANMIPVSWDRVILYHLEEISPGTWQPVLSTS
ncbi:hypothetical protein GSI_00552 [Ganoderma sinense ZZ0214-1]|uniref:DUF6741 domain-containing protein n=1 Tax=Ganoderma sinense ZZ0214-1 TaxID=1077348 RepID=A0A2G8ST04_9APHY|nr:hypothetical protein GSI_00552 [Ganoderma sinense ZZ0214-1]